MRVYVSELQARLPSQTVTLIQEEKKKIIWTKFICAIVY